MKSVRHLKYRIHVQPYRTTMVVFALFTCRKGMSEFLRRSLTGKERAEENPVP